MPYIPSPRNLKPRVPLTCVLTPYLLTYIPYGVSRPEIRYRHDHIVINQAGSRAYQQNKETSHPETWREGGVRA